MSAGIVTTATVTSFVLNTICLVFIIALSVKSIGTKEDAWGESNTTKNMQTITTATLSFYAGAVFVHWIFYIVVMTIGSFHTTFALIPWLTYFLFTSLFLTGLILTLYIWIERARNAFESTEYHLSPSFIKLLQIMFWAICILGGCFMIIWICSKLFLGSSILAFLRKIFAGLFGVVFITEIIVILYAYCKTLSQLKAKCGRLVKAFDRGVAQTMTKLTALQIKLSLLLIMLIVGLFIALLLSIVLENEMQFIPLCIISLIAFICIYCSVPGHRNEYRQMCRMCLWCCMKYAHSYDELMILYSVTDGEAVKSKSDTNLTAETNKSVPATPTITAENTITN